MSQFSRLRGRLHLYEAVHGCGVLPHQDHREGRLLPAVILMNLKRMRVTTNGQMASASVRMSPSIAVRDFEIF
jgi:hypothetical protein